MGSEVNPNQLARLVERVNGAMGGLTAALALTLFDDDEAENVRIVMDEVRRQRLLVTTLSARVEALTQDRDEARAKLCVPGLWRCAKCEFVLVQSNLNAHDGTVTARDTPGDKCPNDGSPLWRMSWEDNARDMAKTCETQVERALAAEAELQWIAMFADVRSQDDSKTFARVNRGALRTIRARAALNPIGANSDGR